MNRVLKQFVGFALGLAFLVPLCAYTKDEVLSWEQAGKHYGETATVEGKIVAAHNSGKACFLNFHKNYKKYFTAVIFASDYDKFPDTPEKYYLNKTVRINGLIKEYQGKPEIIVKNPDQITMSDGSKIPDSAKAIPPTKRIEQEKQKENQADEQSEMVYVTRTGKKYHRAECSSLRKSMIPMKLSDARRSFGPCGRCNPPR